MVKLYSTHCPRCKIIEMKLSQKKIDFEIIDDEDAVVSVGKAHGIMGAPILAVDDKYFKFEDAVKFINERE